MPSTLVTDWMSTRTAAQQQRQLPEVHLGCHLRVAPQHVTEIGREGTEVSQLRGRP